MKTFSKTYNNDSVKLFDSVKNETVEIIEKENAKGKLVYSLKNVSEFLPLQILIDEYLSDYTKDASINNQIISDIKSFFAA
jgi:hypothetical protein